MAKEEFLKQNGGPSGEDTDTGGRNLFYAETVTNNRRGEMMGRLFVAAVLMSAVCSQASAGPTYVVGVEALNYYPHYSNADGTFSGFARDLLDAFAQTQGYRFDYRPLPVARLYKTFFAGELDFKYPDNPDWQTSKRQGLEIHYSAPLASYIDGVLLLPANQGKGVARLTSLGTVRGFTPRDYLDAIARGSLEVREVTTLKQSLLQGINGRVDGVYMNVDVGRYQLDKVLNRPGALVFDESLPHSSGAYRLSSIRHPTLLDALNVFIHSHAAEVQAMKDKYGLQ